MGTDVFHHPWLGGLFADDELAGVLSPERQLHHMLRVEAAYLRALGCAGAIQPDLAARGASQVEVATVDIEALKMGTGVDGVVVPALVRQLRAAADPELRDLIHTGLTSQDVIDTALVLSLKDVVDLLDRRLGDLGATLATLNEDTGAAPLMAWTRMQAAVLIDASDRIDTWLLPIADHRQRLSELSPRLLQLQFGGAAGNRAASGAAAASISSALADELGLEDPDRAWHAMRSPIAEFAGWLSLVSGTFGKMGQDIALMAQQGVDAVALTTGGGSSAMPHKQNPIAAETLVALARFNATLLSGVHQSLVHELERSGAAWTLEWMLLPQMIQATGRGLLIACHLSKNIARIGTDVPGRGQP